MKKIMALITLVLSSEVTGSEYNALKMFDQAELNANKKEIKADKAFMAAINTKPSQIESIPEGMLNIDQETIQKYGGAELSLNDKNEHACAPDEREGIFIFISRSMDKGVLKDTIQHSIDANATLLIQGVMEGQSLEQNKRWWAKLLKDKKVAPRLQIDSQMFDTYEVKRVPQMVIKTAKETAKVKGRSNAIWFKNKVDEEGYEDFGVLGTTYEIAEKNLIEDAYARAEKIDWEGEREKVRDRMWNSLPNQNIPSSEKGYSYHIDPTMTALKDIKDGNGNIIAKKGTRSNPLDELNMHWRYVIINPNNEDEISYAKSLISSEKIGDKPIRVVVTGFGEDPKVARKTYFKIRRALQRHPYALFDNMIDRFEIENTPALFYQEGNMVRVDVTSKGDLI
ncbi:hypothetical protein A3715_26925 [Oleiphilus sp. HI0009]|nr:hypothetical protein A3715_15345 [Oleiphilus sp. HI0009]KZX86333.1 hypothetical protein A3715_26925 [Oleiphilus sp. HI0009]